MRKNETIQAAAYVKDIVPEVSFSQLFTIMDIDNDKMVTLDELFHELNLINDCLMQDELIAESRSDLDKLHVKLTNTSLDEVFTLSNFKSFWSQLRAANVNLFIDKLGSIPEESPVFALGDWFSKLDPLKRVLHHEEWVECYGSVLCIFVKQNLPGQEFASRSSSCTDSEKGILLTDENYQQILNTNNIEELNNIGPITVFDVMMLNCMISVHHPYCTK